MIDQLNLIHYLTFPVGRKNTCLKAFLAISRQSQQGGVKTEKISNKNSNSLEKKTLSSMR